MINANHGQIDICGSYEELCSDMVCIIRSFYKVMKRNVGDEKAFGLISFIGQLAFDDEVMNKIVIDEDE